MLLALAVLRKCHTSGVAGSGSVTKVSHKWCCWLRWRYKRVTQVMSLAMVVFRMCHASDGVQLRLWAELRNMVVGKKKVVEIHAAQTF
jgi:hypothetical protein